jgi:hypothetical protein
MMIKCIMYVRNYARTIYLHPSWSWYEWPEPERACVGLGKPCDDPDMELFYASIVIDIGNGKTTKFWHAPWLDRLKPKDMAPTFLAYRCKKIIF